jgi:hypothetical protein
MRHTILALFVVFVFTACASPEVKRSRGYGPGADVGNRDDVVEMHEGAQPFWKTPKIIPGQPPPLDTANQAHELSRRRA